MKTILAALDLTDTDQQVIKKACQIAKAFEATLQLVHVFPPEITAMDYLAYVPVDPGERKAALDRAKQRLDVVAEELKGEGVSAVACVRVGHDADEILDQAKELNADLTVIGTHSRNRLERAILGSTADKVVRCSVSPVLVVPVEV